MGYELQYVVTEKDLKIIFRRGLIGERDSQIYSTNPQPNETLKTLSALNLDSLDERYRNPCIMDGSQISVKLKKVNKVISVHLGNYYHKDIGLAIESVNKLTPEMYRIWYEKDKLLKDQKRCEEAM